MFALILELFIYLEDFRPQLSSTTSKSKLYFERNVVYFYKTQKALKISVKVRMINEPRKFSCAASWPGSFSAGRLLGFYSSSFTAKD
ncbi:MAG TPA: hypothetical protein PLG04_07360 [Anaerolineaceae bacterium]|nr:hypothetical protein [Anaerolineaceae bacterium]